MPDPRGDQSVRVCVRLYDNRYTSARARFPWLGISYTAKTFLEPPGEPADEVTQPPRLFSSPRVPEASLRPMMFRYQPSRKKSGGPRDRCALV
jgi:hypothetical protein